MKSERLRPSALAARSISDFCPRLMRRLMFSPRFLPDFVNGVRISPPLCIYIEHTSMCAQCKHVGHVCKARQNKTQTHGISMDIDIEEKLAAPQGFEPR